MTDILTCPKCKVKVIPWTVGDGTIDHFRCPQCLTTDETHHWLHKLSINKPLGIVDAHYLNRPGQYSAISIRRTKTKR
jgi:Zn-finger nucleic acid-binding protein